MGGLNRGTIGKSGTKTIAQSLLVVPQIVELEAVDDAAGIGNGSGVEGGD